MPTGQELKALAGGGQAPRGSDLKALLPEGFVPVPEMITPEQQQRGGGLARTGSEIAGATVGGFVGAPAGIPGVMAGAGLGGAAGGQIHDLMTGRAQDQSLAEQGRQVASDVLFNAPGGGVGGTGARVGENVLRNIARGSRTREAARIAGGELLKQQARFGVPADTRGAGRKVFTESLKQLLGISAGGGAGALVTGEPVGAMAGAVPFLINALRRTPAVTQDLLANNPRFARWALSTGSSRLGGAVGAGAGSAAAQAVEGAGIAADSVSELLDIFDEAEGQERQAIKEFADALALEAREEILRRQGGE